MVAPPVPWSLVCASVLLGFHVFRELKTGEPALSQATHPPLPLVSPEPVAEYLLLTPEGDIEREDLALSPVLLWRLIKGNRTVSRVRPENLFLTEISRGQDWTTVEITELLDEARTIGRALGVQDVDDEGGVEPLREALKTCLGISGKESTAWMVTRGADGVVSGPFVTPSEDAVYLGNDCLLKTSAGSIVHLIKTSREAVVEGRASLSLDPPPGEIVGQTTPLDAAAGRGTPELHRVDARLFPMKRDSTGRRFRDFRSAVELVNSGRFIDWLVDGPLTVRWVLRHMLAHGGTPLGFFQRFLSDTRLDHSATGIAELYAWCKFFETLVTYDQVDPSRLAACELGVRRIQMICDKWKHKLPAAGIGGTGSGDIFEDSHLLLGTSETRGAVCLAPALQEWRGEQLAKEAAANIERRKAREERALAANKA